MDIIVEILSLNRISSVTQTFLSVLHAVQTGMSVLRFQVKL